MQTGLQVPIGVQRAMTHNKKLSKPSNSLLSKGISRQKMWNFITSFSYQLPNEPANLTDEELVYIAYAVTEAEKNNKKRIVSLIHLECDDNTVCRFHELFTDEDRKEIMFNC